MKTLNEVIEIARPHAAANGSAGVCFASALFCSSRGDELGAMRQARRAIAHAVGIFHADFMAASGNVAPSCVL